MKQKHIDACREVRLWIGQVIVPGVILAGALLSNPQVRTNASELFKSIKSKIAK